jgi:hypothetical protein
MSSAPPRIKGQEVTIIFTRGGSLEDTLTNTKDFEFEPKLEIKEQGFLGEKTNRHDDIFNGAKFTGTIQLTTQDWFKYQKAIIDRATRRTPDVVFNITAVMEFPNGDTPTVMLPDVKFGPQPGGIRSRGDYVEVKIEGACDDYIPTPS